MRYIALLFAAALLLLGQPPAPVVPEPGVKPEDKCTIEGSVINATTGEAIKKVTITLSQFSNPGRTLSGHAAATDAAGHYKFENVDPGRYMMSADRTGFVNQQYGAKKAGGRGTSLALTSGQNMTDAVFRLTPQGVVAGRVVDEDGDPMARVMVQCLRYMYNNGRKQLVPAGVANTNDLGEYRVFGLAPGRYFLSAVHQQQQFQAAPPPVNPTRNYEEGYAPVYYPNAPSAEAAAPLDVTPGAQLRGLDLTLTKKRTVRLRGVVSSSGTGRAARANVTLIARDSNDPPSGRAFSGRGVDDKGNFEIHSVLPGSYFLVAQIFEDNKQSTAKLPIEVGTSNIDGLQLVVNPPSDLSGRVVVERTAAETQPDTSSPTFNISLQSKVPGPFGGGGGAQADKNGAFTMRNITADAYTVTMYGLRDNFYLKSIRFGDADVTEAGLDFSQGVLAGDLTLTVSADGGQIDGTVQNEKSEPAAGATVVLIPNAEKRSIQRLYKTALSDQNGSFSLKGITPGEYKLFAWEQIEMGAYQDPDFLKRYDSKGEAISIKEKSNETKQLKALPADDMK